MYLDGRTLDGEGLHAFLGDALARCARIGHHLHDQYALQ
jgi:hypothetical protein